MLLYQEDQQNLADMSVLNKEEVGRKAEEFLTHLGWVVANKAGEFGRHRVAKKEPERVQMYLVGSKDEVLVEITLGAGFVGVPVAVVADLVETLLIPYWAKDVAGLSDENFSQKLPCFVQ